MTYGDMSGLAPDSNATVTQYCKHRYCKAHPNLCASVPPLLESQIKDFIQEIWARQDDLPALAADNEFTDAQNDVVYSEDLADLIDDNVQSIVYLLPQNGLPLSLTPYPQASNKAQHRFFFTAINPTFDGGDDDVGSCTVTYKGDDVYRVVCRVIDFGFSLQGPPLQLILSNSLLYNEVKVQPDGSFTASVGNFLNQNFVPVSDIPTGNAARLGAPPMACKRILQLTGGLRAPPTPTQ
jgi:hypothetical protein